MRDAAWDHRVAGYRLPLDPAAGFQGRPRCMRSGCPFDSPAGAKQPQTTQTNDTQHYHKTRALVPQITPTTSFPGLDVG